MTRAADEFALWLETVHPDVYEALYAMALKQGVGSRQFAGLGDDGITDISFDPDSIDVSSGLTEFSNSPALTDFNFDPNTLSSPNIVTQPDSGSSGGILSALSSVGNWLISPQGLSSIANVGVAVLKTNAAIDVANAQAAVIQAQAQRAQQNLPPAPITYTYGASGQPVPVYDATSAQYISPDLERAIANGTARAVQLPNGSIGYTLDQSVLGSVLNSGIPWYVWAGLGAVLLIAVLK